MAKVSEQDVQKLKSSVYNANSVMQHLKVKVAEQEQKIEFLRKADSRLERDLEAMWQKLRDKGLI